jgi:hypothetical protein
VQFENVWFQFFNLDLPMFDMLGDGKNS